MALSRFERAEDSPGLVLWQITNHWQRRIRAALVPLGITHVQFVLLASTAWLEQAGVQVTQAALARHVHTDVMMTSEVVRALERKGLLVRVPHPTDTRAKLVSLTAAGRDAAQRALIVVEDADEQFFSPLRGDAARLLRLMQRLASAHAGRQEPSPAVL